MTSNYLNTKYWWSGDWTQK